MAAFDDQEDVSAGTPPNPSLSARRIGYSSRGNAAPVGETEDPPAPPLTLPGPGDDRQQEQEASALRRSYQANQQAAEKQRKQDATVAKKTANAQREADFRAKGQKFYTDSFGDLQPEVDEQGKPRFSQSDWKKAQLDTTAGGKMWALTRRNEAGQTETRAPKLVTSGDLKDPNLYHDFGGLRGEREIAGHVDDLAQSADPETARVAAAFRTKRNAALRNESLKPLRESFDTAASEVDSARLRKGDLDGQIAKLNSQISALDSNPAAKQTAGGILGIGAEPTSEAKRLQAQRATLQSQVDELAKESGALAGSIEKGGALYAKHEQAKTELDLWGHQSKVGELSDLAEQRRTFLRTQKRSEQDDPVLSQILAKQEEFGVKASRTKQRSDELQKEFETERQKAAASKSVVDQETIARQAENLKTGRALLGQSFAKLNEDVQTGRIDPKTAAETRKALLDAERDHARSVGQLAGMADAASAPARKNAIEQSRSARVIAQGEQLYNLEKNAGTAQKAPDGILSAVSQKVGAAMQRVVEGTRDADGEIRKTLARDPSIQEAAKAAAFRAGDSNYSGDLYAKLPGRRIVINPDAFKTEGLGQPGAPKSQTWRDAIDSATKRGDLDPKAALSMRREYAVKEKLSTEAAIDAAIDNDTFRRWLSKERPDLTASNVLSLNSYDLTIPANNPELRAEASRFLKAEPSVAQKIFNGFKMVGVGAMDTAGSAVRAVLPEDSAASTAIQEFSKGLNSLSMDARLDHHWMSTIGQGLGSSLAFAAPAGAAAGLATGLKLSEKAVKWTVAGMVAGLGSAAQGQQMYDEARQAGADKDVADGARWLGYVLGSTEALGGINDIVQRFGAAKAFSIGSALRSAVAEMTEETVQEIGQQGGNNAVARILYDQNRDLFEGFADSATGAGGSAAIMSTIASVVAGVRYRRVVDVLNAARQTRTQAEAQLADVYSRPETEAVKSLLPTTSILHPLDEQRTALETAVATEAAKKNPSEDVMLSLHEQLAQLEIMRGSAARSLAGHAVDVTQAVAQSSALPDFVQIDPETNAPINDPATIGANRDAANALVKIGVGVPVAQLTEAEQQGLATVGEQLGSDMVRDIAGQPVVTDKAREWLVDQAPAASRILRETETERTAALTTPATQSPKGATKSNEENQIQKEKGLLKPEPSAAPVPAKVRSQTEGASASVSFTNDAGKTERVVVPTDATVPSTGAPVSDQASAEQWLAETSKTPVRDVQFMATKPGKPAPVAASASKPTAPTVKQSLTVRPGSILPHLVKRMRAAGADDRTIANSATALAKRVNETVGRYSGLFGGRVEVTDQSSRSGGFSYDANRDTLVISSADLGADAETLSSNPERVGQLIREEAIHRAAVRLEKSGAWKADDLWGALTPATRDAFTRAYNQGKGEKDGARTTGAWSMGHEMVRMLVQGRLAVENGRLTLDGAAISEETASPGVIAKIADVLRKLRDYFTDLAGQLTADGNDPKAVAEVNRVVELVTLKLQALEKATSTPAASPAQNTAETVEGEKLKGEWVAFAPESGTLGIPRSEMPQFQNEHLGALTQFLAARGITHTSEEVLPGSLKPSQAEYSPKKVANVVAKAASGQFGPRSILISSDGYILDRHHQFVAALTGAPQTPIPVIRFSAPIRELFDVVHDFPSVEYAGGSKAAPAAGKTETAPKPITREPNATNANATGSTKPDAGASAPAPIAERQKLAATLGVDPEQIGSTETVTHKGRTVRVVNLVLDINQVDTSHNPDGTINPDYPQALQPRDRSAAVYRDQQRRIASNPNLTEEFLSGTPDRGTPIMATVDGKAVTLIGNGRANAKALMYSAPDLADTAAKFKASIAARAAEKGLTAEAVNAIAQPVLVRHILDPLTLPELRSLSQESNEFSGAATNAVEQAKVDASRLTPAALASFNPEFDLDSAKNEDFRREFVRSVIGRAENITGPDLRRRVQAALFAKAFGDTEQGMAAFSRLAGEDDEGTRNLVRSMLEVAPAFAAMRAQIDAGNLHPLDLAPALTRAVQEIAVALREKPSAQSADVALDGLVNQTDLALDGARAPLDEALLRFLVANRRNRADLTAGLSRYTAGVYAAGDPKQGDMFGQPAPTSAEILRAAVEDPQADARRATAEEIGRVLNSGLSELPGDEQMLLDGGSREFPIGDFRVIRSAGRESRLKFIPTVWPMFVAAYEKKGMMYQNAAEMLNDNTLFDVYHNAAGVPVSFSIKKLTPYGYKGISSGTNGTEEGKAAWRANVRELSRPGNYAELSDTPLHIAINKENLPSVPASEAAAILGKTILPEPDGFGYSRVISGLTKHVVKRMVGIPFLWKTNPKPAQNSAPTTSGISPSSPKNSPTLPSAPSGKPTSSRPGETSERPTGKTPLSSSPTNLSSGLGGDDLFGSLLGDYAQQLPPKAKRNKAEAKKIVAKEIPSLPAPAFDDLFSLAQTQPSPNENSSRQPDPAPAGQNGGRAFTEFESNDLGPLFGNAGPASAANDAVQADGTADGNVAGAPQLQPDATANDESPRAGVEQAGGSPAIGTDVRDLPNALPGSGDVRGGRNDARAAAEARRLARITRSRALGVNEQNHRIAAGDSIVEGGAKTRLRGNIAAIKLLRRLQTEKRNATPEEKRTLAKYVGWGALSQAFDRLKGEQVAEGELDSMRADVERYENYAKNERAGGYYSRIAETERAKLQSLENWDNAWGEAYRTLKEILSPEEWDAARNSTENAHYTDRGVIGAMWQGLEKMGFKGGRILEPAGGVGHFFGLMPEETMRASELFGVELDTLSGGIFSALYPDAQIQTTGFERARLPDNAFDLVISNVPFSENGPFDPVHDKAKLNLHNYFFAKALDKARPGGLVAFITTANTMEASPRQRAYLSELGDFIGAVRLPNDAFAANAGTQVTTDIVIMRKRDGIGASPFSAPWQQKEKVGEDTIPAADGGNKVVPITINEYFAKNPAQVLGTHSMNGSMYAGPSTNGQYTVDPTPGELLPKLTAALDNLPAAYTESGEVSTVTLATTGTTRNGSFTYQNGELGIYNAGEWKSLLDADPVAYEKAKIRRKVGQFVTLRDFYRDHLALMARPTSTGPEITRSMAELNRLYDSFVGEWGTFENDRGRHKQLKTDPAFYILKGLERVETGIDANGEKTETIIKSDVFSKRTIFPSLSPTTATTALDALRISQSWKGHLDLEYMAELLGQDTDSVKQQLITGGLAFENPRSGLLETKEAYLSGRVREKLRQAEAALPSNPDYQRNVDALRAVQPAAVPPKHITPKLGGGWVPPALLQSFLRHVGFGDVAVSYTQIGEFDKWTVKPSRFADTSPANLRTFSSGTEKNDLTGLELLSHALDQRTPQIFDPPAKKGEKSTFNPRKTSAANSALKRLLDEWEKFAKGDSEVTVTIDGKEITAPVSQITAEAFNETFNGTVPRVYDGSHLDLPGSAPFLLGPADQGGLRPHQKNGIWRAVQEGNAFLAHGVGAGKTRELIAIAMEWKRLGLAKKPMLVVHNPTLNQFANETRKIYPGARALVATKQDLQKENRRAFAARVASGDWDLIVIAHSSFNLIDDDPAVVTKYVNEQLAEVEAALLERLKQINAKSSDDREAKKDPTVKQLVKMLNALKTRLEKAAATANKDNAVLFQELGVDGLLVDEAHMFKKVPFVSKMGQVAGLDMSSSARASNLLMRLNHVRDKNNGRNVVLATGTPITNTLAEVWNMIRLTSPTTLKEFGVPTFDQFSASFGQVVESLEMNPAGKWVPRRRFAKFVNGTGLAAFIRSIMDVQLNLELGQPKIANGGLTPVVTARTPGIDAYMAHLEELYTRWQNLEGEDKQLYSAIPLVISGVAKAATMDMRLIDPALPDDPASKVNRALEKIAEFYAQEKERKGVQVVFADQYRQISTDYLDAFAGGKFVPPTSEDAEATDEKLDEDGNVIDEEEATDGFNLYRDIKAKLIARGIPEREIAIAGDYNTDIKRADLFAKANAGYVRILIGSTQKLGVGVNVQERLYAMHHLDTPWTPADLEQRIGRGWRSGNRYTEWGIPIQNIGYGVERTMDAGRYQVIETKSRFVKQAMEGKSGFEFEDPAGGLVDAAAELKAQFTGDPRVMEMVSLENQVRELELQADAHDTRRREFAGMMDQMKRDQAVAERDEVKRADILKRIQAVAAKGLTPEELDDIDTRLDLAETAIISDGALQSETARNVWNRILAPGITLAIFAKGQLTLGEQKETDSKALVQVRMNAVMTVDGEALTGKGITSERSKGLAAMFARDVALAQSYVTSARSIAERSAAKQAEAKTEMERPFPASAELARKKARLAELSSSLKGGEAKTLDPLADGRGPGGTMPALASGRAVLDPNQLEFEAITSEELAAVDRVLAESDRAGRVKEGLPIADAITRKFSNIPGIDLDDIRQEARVALISAAKSYDSTKGLFKPYAGTVIRNRLRAAFNSAIARIRREGLSADIPNEFGATIADNTAAQDDTRSSTEIDETRRLLSDAISALPPRLQNILNARGQGESFETIAQREGVSKQAVAKLADNAMKFVRAKLKKAGVKSLESDGVLASGTATPQTETPEFKAWFGASKMVNSDGTPRIYYHGTNSQFYAFDPKKRKEGLYGKAFFFSPERKLAEKYGKIIIPVYLQADQHFNGLPRPSEIDHSKSIAFQRGENIWVPDAEQIRRVDDGGIPPKTTLKSSPAEDESAIAELMHDLARDIPAGAIGQAMSEGAIEPPGNQTVGNPDLANPAGPDAASRKVMNAVDEARKETMERETHEQWRTAAVAMIERDRPGVLRDLLAKASDGLAFDNPVQVKAAQLLVNDLIQQAVADRGNTEAMRQAQILAWSYREAGAEQARAFTARRDPFKRPADRYREFLAGAVFTPTPALRKQLATTWTPAEKQRRIAALTKQLADARAAIPADAPSIPADVQKRIASLNQALGEARQQKDRIELLNTSLGERMKRIEAEFAKMGVTLDDMFAGEAYLRLRGQQLDNNIFDKANYSAIKRRALSLIKKGWSDDYIARKTGLSSAQVAGFYQEHVAALRERLSKLGDAALDPSKLDALNLTSAAARLASGEASLSAAERAARIEQMIAAMGYAKNDVRQQRTRRAPAARRNPKPTPTPTATGETIATEPGATPAYPEATGATPNDFGNRNLGLGENASAQPTGATPPSTNGPTGELENDAAPSSRLPGRTPAYPGATGRANPYDFADEESAPPAFDISDPVHVAQAARTIQSLDGNRFDMVTEYWINAVLSGPLTQGANIIGNSANTVWDFTFKRFGEAALNTAAFQDQNAPQLGEFRHMLRATQPALARAWRNALRTWTAESPMFENDVLNQQLDLSGDFEKGGSTRSAISGRTGKVIRTPGRLLMATDDFFKSWIAHVEAAAQAYRIAKSEGLTGPALESRIAGLVNLPGSAAWLAAVTKAQELTFQEKHEGQSAGSLLQILGKLRELDIGGGIKPFRFVIPFTRTPFNIFSQGLRQSPAGMALLLTRFAQAGFYRVSEGRPIAQTYPRPEMIKHTVEQLMAWTAAALVYGAAAGDDDDEDKPILITGSIPFKDSGINALNQRRANQAYTVRIGNAMVSYGRIEPAATILGTTIDMIQAAKRSRRDKDQFDAVGALMQSIAQQAEEKTFLRGIGDLVSAAQGSRKGDRSNYLANLIASFVPNLIRQPLAKLDPYVRDRSGGFGERLASSVVPQLAEPKVDAYGEKITQPGLAGWRALVPITVRQAPDVQRVDRLLNNWNQAHPEDDWGPLPLNRTLRLNAKTTRQMTAAELREYATKAGRLASQMLRNAALNVEKPTADDMKRVKNAFSTARTITRRQMFGATAQEIDSP